MIGGVGRFGVDAKQLTSSSTGACLAGGGIKWG